jgi:hypothetical protein
LARGGVLSSSGLGGRREAGGKAAGAKGQEGEKGVKGLKGEKGEKGVKGLKGVKGAPAGGGWKSSAASAVSDGLRIDDCGLRSEGAGPAAGI